ncbi:MAG: hypothetical protein Q8R92_16795 [Deltaproteobacteria bacterium]|nr:hypothetical protein [Deltaproteobacteria bacterium]
MKSKLRKFTLWTYDVWGNARDGFDVNDRYKHGDIAIRCKREVFNAGTPCEFETFNPTDLQLSRAAGFSRVSWETHGDGYYTATTANGRPVGELVENTD